MQQNYYICQKENHPNQEVIAICLNNDCKEFRPCCYLCYKDYHSNHFEDIKNIQNLKKIFNDECKIEDMYVGLQNLQSLLKQVQINTQNELEILNSLIYQKYDTLEQINNQLCKFLNFKQQYQKITPILLELISQSKNIINLIEFTQKQQQQKSIQQSKKKQYEEQEYLEKREKQKNQEQQVEQVKIKNQGKQKQQDKFEQQQMKEQQEQQKQKEQYIFQGELQKLEQLIQRTQLEQQEQQEKLNKLLQFKQQVQNEQQVQQEKYLQQEQLKQQKKTDQLEQQQQQEIQQSPRQDIIFFSEINKPVNIEISLFQTKAKQLANAKTNLKNSFIFTNQIIPKNEITSFKMKIIQVQQFVGVGIAHKNQLEKKMNVFNSQQFQDACYLRGAYLIGSNELSFSPYIWDNEHGLQKCFKFTANDIIEIFVNPFQGSITWIKKDTNKTFTMPFQMSNDLVPCACLFSKNDSIQIV